MTGDRRLPGIVAFGEAAVLVELAESPGTEVARAVHSLAAAVARTASRGIRSVTPGFTSLLVEFDPLAVERGTVEAAIRSALEDASPTGDAGGRHRSIPVVYGGEHGPDLEDVAELTSLTPDEVVARHAATIFDVFLLGFSPGFPYLGELPVELDVPRLATPRTRTPAGSVAITGRFSGIYPVAAPVGWRVIGRTSVQLFDPTREVPSYLLPGDTVTFRAVSADDLDPAAAISDDW